MAGVIAAGGCRSSAPLWPELSSSIPQGVALLEYRSTPSHFSYWVDHRSVGQDIGRAIAIIQSSGKSRVVVHSEYKLFDWGCAIRTRLLESHLEVVSLLMAASIAPGWESLGEESCASEAALPTAG